jgi:hypothetical protein
MPLPTIRKSGTTTADDLYAMTMASGTPTQMKQDGRKPVCAANEWWINRPPLLQRLRAVGRNTSLLRSPTPTYPRS